ncbi:endonuclease domain-containing protein [Candidatus Kuenenbacteria bacterium]|nr:endonuclease domain-containing protein [Candidatus Kuenenbacteria bacterium]
MSYLIPFAKNLRKNSTEAEKLLWRYLRTKQFNNLKFRRQQVIGKYIVDFVCFNKKIIIKLDGGQHAEKQNKTEYSTS